MARGKLVTAFLKAGSVLGTRVLPAKAFVRFNEKGQLHSLTFPYEKPTTISAESKSLNFDGLIVKANYPYKVYENGQPRKVRFFSQQMYRGKLYPKQTEVEFDRNGDVVKDSFHDVAMHDNYKKENGMLPEILPVSQVRQGIFLPKGSIVYPTYHGNLERVLLSRPVRYKNAMLAFGEIQFNKRNSLLWLANLHDDQLLQGVRFRGSPESVMFDELGQVSWGKLAGDQRVGKYWFADGSKVNLHVDLTPMKGTLARKTMYNDIPLKSDTEVRLDKDGNLMSGYLAEDHTIGDLTYKQGTNIRNDQQHKYFTGTLAHNHRLMGTVIPSDTVVRTFNGKLWCQAR